MQFAAHRRQTHGFADLLQHGQTDGLRKFFDLHGHRGLRHIQLLGGARKATEAGNRFEHAQLGQGAVAQITADFALGHGKPFLMRKLSFAMLTKRDKHGGLHLEQIEGRKRDLACLGKGLADKHDH